MDTFKETKSKETKEVGDTQSYYIVEAKPRSGAELQKSLKSDKGFKFQGSK